MAKSTKNPRKKSRGRPAIGVGIQVNAMLRPKQAAQLDAWIAKQPEPHPTRPEAIRRLLEKALGPSGPGATIPLENLNAENDE